MWVWMTQRQRGVLHSYRVALDLPRNSTKALFEQWDKPDVMRLFHGLGKHLTARGLPPIPPTQTHTHTHTHTYTHTSNPKPNPTPIPTADIRMMFENWQAVRRLRLSDHLTLNVYYFIPRSNSIRTFRHKE